MLRGAVTACVCKQDACTGVHSACRREENGHNLDICVLRQRVGTIKSRDAGTGGAGGAAAPLAFCWEGQGGQKCPLSM